uniref:1,3-beta-glucan synthase n=1 Tax=Oryza punctata TaxID=4537 RepID=A0A0E0K807_ORYPU
MARAAANWERLVRAALRGERLAGAFGVPVTGIAGNVPSSLGNNVHIDEVLRAADEIQDEDPTVARILCEHAYTLAQNLDPNSEGRGVLQFKTGLMSVIRQKLAKREGGAIDRSQDVAKLQEFYKLYREKHKVDELCEDEMKLRESAVFSGNLGELERKTLKRKKVLATLKVLWSVIEEITREISPEDADKLISEEMKRVIQKDAERTEDVVAYNIIPLDALSTTNAIVNFPEVRAAISALQYHRELPRLPATFSVPDARNSDMLDLLHCVFGFQKDNVTNQREHVVHLLANEQSRLGKLPGNEPKIDEGAVHVVFSKALDNYIKWCNYLPLPPVWNNTESLMKEKKLLYVCLYYLIWGEAANLARELEEIIRRQTAEPAKSCISNGGVSFLDQVISPIYEIIAAEAANNDNGRAPHSAWRNYDDFNEFFWSPKCFQLGWPWNISNPFFSKPSRKEKGLMIIAFNGRKFDTTTVLILLSLGPTYVIMKFIESTLDIWMMYGAYSTSRGSAITRVLWRFCWFTVASKAFQDGTNSATFKIYVFVISAYVGAKIIIGLLMSVPCCHGLTGHCYRWSVVRLAKWMHQIEPLVEPTRDIIRFKLSEYAWHDFISKNNHNAVTILSLWAPVIYLLDIHVFYTVMSAICGFLLGARDRLGEIRSVEAVHRFFEKFPEAFMDKLHVAVPKRKQLLSSSQHSELNKFDASKFAPFWNEIVRNMREEDYINNTELDLLLMPKNNGSLPIVQWPLFLLASKVFLAKDIAIDCKDSQEELWLRISKDEYMQYAVVECYHSIHYILTSILDKEGRLWVERIYVGIRESISKRNIQSDLHFSRLPNVIAKLVAVAGILKETESADLRKGAINAIQDLYEVVHHEVLSVDMSGNIDEWEQIKQARAEGRLFNNLKWPTDSGLKDLIKRLYSLLTIKESAANVPKNLEARRRLEFFTNSLFMQMPVARPVSEMLSFSVFTPYYSETVLYSKDELQKRNEDGISTLFYLQKIYPDEWKNFLARINRDENTTDSELFSSPNDMMELRLWASYRGQTLARTVRGMMYYRKALMLQSYLEKLQSEDIESAFATTGLGLSDMHFELSPEARAQADLKFTYVVTCQIYGVQKGERKPEAADIALLMQRNEALRVAYVDIVESVKNGKPSTEYYSKLVKADIHGNDKEIYSIKLPGNFKLGEGKPENQNHAIIFTRGNAVQTIDMNQDNYFEEALKMRNLLEEFYQEHGKHKPSILGVREHVFTGRVRMHYGHPDVFDRIFHITRGGISKASRVINISEDIYAGFNSTLRLGNITHHEYIQVGKGRDVGLNQIALFEGKVAGGNGEQVLSRDIYRLGQLFDFFRMLSFYVTTIGFYFCTMLTVWTVYIFLYGKTYLALSGVGELIRSRADILQNTALNAALNTQFLFQIGVFTAIPMILGFILEFGVLTLYLPMLFLLSNIFCLEKCIFTFECVTQAFVSFITMQFQLCSLFFTFSLGTRTHYFGRTILHGGAKYRATGRGFVVRHIKFAENYRLYSRSHFVKGLEVALLLVIFLAYGFNDGGAVGYILLSISSWFMAVSWLFAPYIFNPSGFEWQKVVEDFRDWTNWLFYRGGIGVKGEESWEAWWDEELAHIHNVGGRILETVLSLRFFIFQYGVVYHMDASGSSKALLIYWISWAVLGGLFVLLLVFGLNPKAMVHFQLFLRLIKSIALLMVLAGLVVAVVFTSLSVSDVFAAILAFVPTGWGVLSIAVAWKPIVKKLGLWKTVRSLARLYDAGTGMIIFVPIAIFSWFPFISTFQTRLLFNQAFSRGLEISLILAGNNPNAGV